MWSPGPAPSSDTASGLDHADDPEDSGTAADGRDLAAGARDEAAADRDQAGDRRDAAADGRDADSGRRDAAAVERDTAAALRDAVADQREAAQDAGGGSVASRDAVVHAREGRRAAAEDRASSSRDRTVGAAGRQDAGRDRSTASADRTSSATGRREAGTDRSASARDRHDASLDALTQTWVRGPGLLQLERELVRARRTGQPLTLAFVDVDGLKQVNDTGGHAAGDRLLVLVSAALRRRLRPYDLVLRFGGDEFVCVVAGLGASETRTRLDLVTADLVGHGSITAGVVCAEPEDDVPVLLARADAEMYALRAPRDQPSQQDGLAGAGGPADPFRD